MADISRSEMSDGSDCAEAFVFDAAEAGRPEDDDDEARSSFAHSKSIPYPIPVS